MKKGLTFTRITNSKSKLFEKAWRIYEEAFPSETKRSLDSQTKTLESPEYNFNLVYQNNSPIGIIAHWDFKDFSFIEHLAIDKNLRSKGLGTKLLQKFLNSKLTILEVHKPVEEIDKRRIEFYKRNSFKLNEFDYLQPAYEPDKKAVPLFIMSSPRTIELPEFEKIREVLHKGVYGLPQALVH
jgi:ribosomal protein S18 acetylase RimI-like enzyme